MVSNNRGAKRSFWLCGNFNRIGKGFVKPCKVRIYHRFWGRLAPIKIKLDWNDNDAIPFVYYHDLKRRIMLGSSDEKHVHLFNKIERCRFEYAHIYLVGRLWTKRKMIVIDQFSDSDKDSKYIYFGEFMEIMKQYVKGFDEYRLIFPKSENGSDAYMNTINEVYEKCFEECALKAWENHSPIGRCKKMTTGLSAIDKLIGELKTSELVVIAGYPSMGKTSMLVSITNNLLMRVPIAYFSMEMSEGNVIYRILANVCQVRPCKTSNGEISFGISKKQDDHLKKILTSNLYIDDTNNLTVADLESKIVKMVEDHRVKIVMIDYLQLLRNAEDSQPEELANSLKRLKELAKSLDIAIVAVSKMEQGKKTLRRCPEFSHHQDYKAIRQFADWSFFIDRLDKFLSPLEKNSGNMFNTNHVNITNHHTKKNELVVLEYDKRCMRFNNLNVER